MEKASRKKRPVKVHRSPKPELAHFRLVIAYKGTRYRGWQKQAKSNGPATVQERIEKALRKILKQRKVLLHGSGRTDSGVHARGQVAHLRAHCDLPASVLIKALNAHLPDDIRILRLEPCAPEFHAQLDVSAKTYRYFLLNTGQGKDPVQWPFLHPYSWFVSYTLDLEKMRLALSYLVGKHDFKSFQNVGTPLEDTVREILSAELIEFSNADPASPPWMPGPDCQAQLLEIRIRGTGFLKQMVRTIAGTLVEVGRGRISPEEIPTILARKDRTASGITAPAHGLFLDSVEY